MLLRALSLRVETAAGLVGADLTFDKGLVLIRGASSRGKSLCMQSVIFALGLEGMLGPSRAIPLKHAMTDFVEIDGADVPVLASDVFLELANGRGDVITTRRTAKGERAPELVTVWFGPKLSQGGSHWTVQDFFVRLAGGATNEAGFHRFLAQFFGWSLPSALRYDGEEGPLYIECVFPLVYVEQMKGWTAIEGRFPTHLRIREPGARAVEFLLDLDVRDLADRRALLRASQDQVRNAWATIVAQADAMVAAVGARLENVPRQPTSDWPTGFLPAVRLAQGDEWASLGDYLNELAARRDNLAGHSIPRVAEVAPLLQEELKGEEERLQIAELRARMVASQLQAANEDMDRVSRRLRAIEEDLVRNKDARRLEELGSAQHYTTEGGECPTCHQAIGVALLPDIEAAGVSPMSLDDNIAFLDEQRKVFLLMRSQVQEQVDAYSRQLVAAREEANSIRANIRTLKATLTADARQQSTVQLAESIRIDERIRELSRAAKAAVERTNALTELSAEWVNLRNQLQTLPTDRLSEEDTKKLASLQGSFTEQLVEYGLDSLNPTEISISRDSYRPVYEGFDLQFDLAGSDTIRAAWAYHTSLLEVARVHETNHPGILLIDEPQQHNPSDESFAALLRRLTRSSQHDQQVIVATSENQDKLDAALRGLPYQQIELEGRLLKRLQ